MSLGISFSFKKFDIDDRRCGMKVGTDGVALGAWVGCENVTRAIDIGCGSGLIALMLAQRCGAMIEAIDIDRGACQDACDNVARSPWADRIKVISTSLAEYIPSFKADLIVSNPPFFADGALSPCAERASARHEGSLNYRTLIDFAAAHLAPSGRLAFIYPYGREDDIIYKAEMSHLKLRSIATLRQRASRPPVRTMYEFSLTDGPIIREDIIIRNDDGLTYTEAFGSLCKDFYLEL